MHLIILNRKFVPGLLVLFFGVLLLLVLGVFLMPRSLVKSRVCSMPFHRTLLSDICSASDTQQLVQSAQTLNPLEDSKHDKPLSIATSIYVVSLARRTDRRRVMDLLRDVLHLDWTYFDALDKDDPLIDEILYSVARRRADSDQSLAFKWPETLEDFRLQTLGIETRTFGRPPVRKTALEIEPLLCATEDNTIPTYANTSSIPFHMRLSRGMIACWYSHVRLMTDIAKRAYHIHEDTWDGRAGVTIVFEDDVDVEWDLRERMEAMWVDLPRDWDIVMLGHCWSNETTNPPLTLSSPLHPSHNPKCTHGYVLSPFGARRLLTHLTYPPFAFSRALDQAIAHLISTNRVRSYSVVPSIVVQRRCPLDSINATECRYSLNATEGGDSDIWVSGGMKGSRWRDELEDSALERIWNGDVRVLV